MRSISSGGASWTRPPCAKPPAMLTSPVSGGRATGGRDRRVGAAVGEQVGLDELEQLVVASSAASASRSASTIQVATTRAPLDSSSETTAPPSAPVPPVTTIEPSSGVMTACQKAAPAGDSTGGDSMRGNGSTRQRNTSQRRSTARKKSPTPSGGRSTLNRPMSTQPQLDPDQVTLDAKPSASGRQSVRDLADGQEVAGSFCVRERQLRQKRNGEDFLKLIVADRTGTSRRSPGRRSPRASSSPRRAASSTSAGASRSTRSSGARSRSRPCAPRATGSSTRRTWSTARPCPSSASKQTFDR